MAFVGTARWLLRGASNPTRLIRIGPRTLATPRDSETGVMRRAMDQVSQFRVTNY
jgi:hypothetical protein